MHTAKVTIDISSDGESTFGPECQQVGFTFRESDRDELSASMACQMIEAVAYLFDDAAMRRFSSMCDTYISVRDEDMTKTLCSTTDAEGGE